MFCQYVSCLIKVLESYHHHFRYYPSVSIMLIIFFLKLFRAFEFYPGFLYSYWFLISFCNVDFYVSTYIFIFMYMCLYIYLYNFLNENFFQMRSTFFRWKKIWSQPCSKQNLTFVLPKKHLYFAFISLNQAY